MNERLSERIFFCVDVLKHYIAKMKGVFFILVGPALIVLSSCGIFIELDPEDPLLREFPPEVLPIPRSSETPEWRFEHIAVDINESGKIVGYTNSSGAFADEIDEYDLFPARGFIIDYDGSNYLDISANVEESNASWPLDINDSGGVVGAYLYPAISGGNVLHAYRIDSDGSNFESLHPAAEQSTKATHINEEGRIFGESGEIWVLREAVEFVSDGAGGWTTDRLVGGYVDSFVQAVSNEFVVVYGIPDGDLPGELVLITLDTGVATILAIAGVPSDSATIETIADDGRMVGWYTDYSNAELFGDYGFTYQLGDASAELFSDVINDGQWAFIEYRFYDFQDDGTIVGIGYRISEQILFPQARAISIEWDFTGFADITPPNGAAYSEAYAINENNSVTGYSGFAFKTIFGNFDTIHNRAFHTIIE